MDHSETKEIQRFGEEGLGQVLDQAGPWLNK
jgi:hypothetical protein